MKEAGAPEQVLALYDPDTQPLRVFRVNRAAVEAFLAVQSQFDYSRLSLDYSAVQAGFALAGVSLDAADFRRFQQFEYALIGKLGEIRA